MHQKQLKLFILAALIITSALVALFFLITNRSNTEIEALKEEQRIDTIVQLPPPEPVIHYGMNLDSLFLTEDKIKRNETFSSILQKYKVPKEVIQQLIIESKDKFKVNRLQAGKSYQVLTSKKDSVARGFIYYGDPTQTIVFKTSPLEVLVDQKPTDTIERRTGGFISSSLYETLQQMEAPTVLAYELSKIFERKIDFFKIKKGDNFKIIFDEITLDGQPLSVKKIHSVCFEHDNKKYYAFNFGKDGKDAFYDEEGNSLLQGGFLKAPLKFFRISSKFSKRRFHPVQKVVKAHLGTDYAAPTGTPIMSVADGVVTEAKFAVFNGNYVKIQHNKTHSTQYLHMSRIASGIKPGTKVKQGQVIGYVGSTGLASGPHVCFRFWENGKQIDGTKVKNIKGDPVKKSDMKKFKALKDEMLAGLDDINITEEVQANTSDKSQNQFSK
jgi:murein DD-endopeptidase MepM/ murein hydrolase activator NlpD